MRESKANPLAPSEPDPQLWLTSERVELLRQQLEPGSSLLRVGGLWRATLGYWVRWQASLEAQWPADEEESLLAALEQQWLAKHSLEESCLSNAELRAKLRVTPAVKRWSRQQWGHRLDSLYLQRKSRLDRASCRLLRLRDKNLAHELYHRIKASEASFEQVAQQFGEGPERLQGGLLPLQPLEAMPLGLAPLLERLEPGRLSLPMRLKDGFCLVQLESYQPSQLDQDTEDLLLAEQLRMWIDSVVDRLVADLMSRDNKV